MTQILYHTRGVHDIGASVIAIGVFDGVHRGHQTLVTDAVAVARRWGVASVVLTFDRDPDQIVTPGNAAPQLTSLDDKLALLAGLGPDVILVVPFDRQLASLTPDRFADEVLLDAADPVACIVGYDFRFGAGAAGDVDTLVDIGGRDGFEVITHPLVRIGGEVVTSTRIRGLVSEGAVTEAAELLGRPHRLHGRVVHGRGRGAELGTPTANLDVECVYALPAPGVYAAWATVPSGRRYPAAVSVGVPPMYPEATSVLEAHLIGFSGDLYDECVTVEFVGRLREQKRYASEAELAGAIAADVSLVRQMLTE